MGPRDANRYDCAPRRPTGGPARAPRPGPEHRRRGLAAAPAGGRRLPAAAGAGPRRDPGRRPARPPGAARSRLPTGARGSYPRAHRRHRRPPVTEVSPGRSTSRRAGPPPPGEDWVAELTGDGPRRDAALRRLHELLLRG